jgi:hypothetical protein
MFKKVVSFGCSFSCWRQNFNTGYVDEIAKRLNVPFQNYSLPGNSNDAIIFEFNERLYSEDLSYSLILFQTTFLSRYSYYEEKIAKLLSFQLPILNSASISDDLVGSNYNLFSPTNDFNTELDLFDKKEDAYRNYIKYFYNDSYEYKRLLNQLYHIKNTIEKINSKVIFLYFDSFETWHPFLSEMNFVKFQNNSINCSKWITDNKLNYSEDDLHLSENGNIILADYIYDRYLS